MTLPLSVPMVLESARKQDTHLTVSAVRPGAPVPSPVMGILVPSERRTEVGSLMTNALTRRASSFA